MESLPDDVWHKILQIGIQAKRLDHTDLCSLAIVNNHFDQLTEDPALWDTLLSRDFPSSDHFFQVPSKALYNKMHWVKRENERQNEWYDKWYDNFFGDIWTEPVWYFESFHYPPSRFSLSESLVNREPQVNLSDFNNLIERLSLRFHEEHDPVLPQASQPSLREACHSYNENKLSKRFDKSSRPKVIPNSKSYIPMNRPPRRSMPRKI